MLYYKIFNGLFDCIHDTFYWSRNRELFKIYSLGVNSELETPVGVHKTFQNFEPSKYIWAHVQAQVQVRFIQIKLTISYIRIIQHTNGQKFNKDTFWGHTIMVILLLQFSSIQFLIFSHPRNDEFIKYWGMAA